MKTYLRLATKYDCDLLYGWANNEVVRKNSFNVEKIKYEDHIQWFNKIINSHDSYLYILMDEDIPIGQIRLDIHNQSATINYSIDERYRGKGFGSRMIALTYKQITADNLNVNKLLGKVKYSNLLSQKVFKANDFSREEQEEYILFCKKLKLK